MSLRHLKWEFYCECESQNHSQQKLAYKDAWGGTDMQEATGKFFPSLCAAPERGQSRNFISIPLLVQLPPHKLI